MKGNNMHYTITHDTLTDTTYLNTAKNYAEILTPIHDILNTFETIGALVTSKGQGTYTVVSDISFERLELILESGINGDKKVNDAVRRSIDTLNTVYANANCDGELVA